MKKYLSFILIIFMMFSILFEKQVLAADYFTYLGSEIIAPQERTQKPSAVVSKDGVVYVATVGYSDYNIYVTKYTGLGTTGWEKVGDRTLPIGKGYDVSLVIDKNSTLYLAYDDINNGRKVTVMKYTGNGATGWEAVGNKGFSSVIVSKPSLSVDTNGVLYIAYADSTNSYRATVKKYNGVSWENVGSEAFTSDRASNISLAIDSFGTPYLAYRDWGSDYKATVMKYTGKGIYGWEPVGNVGFSAGQVDYTSLRLSNSGIPYVAYRDDYYNGRATVMMFNGVDWEYVGLPGFSEGTASSTSLAIDNYGTPYVAFSDGRYSLDASVMMFNGLIWKYVGVGGFSSRQALNVSLVIDNEGTPYVAYSNPDPQISVMMHTTEDPIDAEIPIITVQPIEHNVTVGETATLTTSATVKKGCLSYQWYNTTSNTNTGGILVNGATESYFSPPTTKVENYFYYCKVTNYDYTASGNRTTTINTNSVAVTVNPKEEPPIITLQPTSQNVNEWQTATFTAVASGIPAPSVQWQVSTNGGFTWNNVNGSTSTTLNLTGTIENNGNQYQALFINSIGSSISNVVTLSVNDVEEAPTVTTQGDKTVNEGTHAEYDLGAFTDSATDSPWIVEINWGDGSDNTKFNTSIPGEIADQSHAYTNSSFSSYIVTVSVTDKKGLIGSDQFSVFVNYPVTGVTLNVTNLNINGIGETDTLIETIIPSNATNKNVTWTSSDETVAAVSADGTVTAVGNGTAMITVKTADGNQTATCMVTVAVPVTGVTLDKNIMSFTEFGQLENLTATIAPVNAANKTATWTSSDKSVATVNADGTVTAVGSGTATITATTSDGNKTATCTVTVDVVKDYSGIYNIRSVNSDLVMDVYDGGTKEGTNIIQWGCHGHENQQWRFESLENGYYKITSVLNPTYSLDVYDAGTSIGNRVIQWTYHGGTNQQWKVLENADGSVTLMSRLAAESGTGYVLDVFGGGKEPGVNVIQWSGNGGDNQKWQLEPVKAFTMTYDSNGGSAVASSSVKTDALATEPQAPTKEGMMFAGWYQNQALTALWDFAKDRMPAEDTILYAKWQADLSGTYVIRSVNSDLVMDVYNGGTTEGTNIIQWGYHGRENQQWRFESLGNGYYKITSVLNPAYSLDVYDAGTSIGNRVIQWTYHGGTNQQWKVTENADGSYTLMSRLAVESGTGYVLDVFGGGLDEGVNVIQWSGTGGDNQKWNLEAVN